MKKLLLLTSLLLLSAVLFAQETEGNAIDSGETKITLSKEEKKATRAAKKAEKDAKEYNFKFRINEGGSFGQITRIEKMDNRSNFVRETMIAGAFVNFQTVDLYDKIDFTIQLAGYYPVHNAFNGMKQFPKNKLNYAIDGFLGATYTWDKIKYIPIDLSLGLHSMYQLTDEYHMVYVGLGFLGTVNFPLSERWTIVNNYFFSYDDANLGSNKKIQHFDAAYQYHIDLGFRYSKRAKNSYYYIAKKQAL
ncbi:MAG: hypothetical protein MR958_00950 [Spirochaetia bacterium]|nr:hypothetical protein [Spirochaetia bacterium]MDD7269186.1 hypothetical protein [Treponema sp.]MDY4985851.1 hypothetical protein [Treponema sp.]